MAVTNRRALREQRIGMSSLDILIDVDQPSIGSVTFTALDNREIEFLRWMAEGVGAWNGGSLSLPMDYADSVYQTCLMNGLVLGFNSGETVQLSLEALYNVDELLHEVDVVTQANKLFSNEQP